MAVFPTLNSGAVTQYPISTGTGQRVEVIQFIDGTDQRFLDQGRQFRKWQINLSLLSDAEIEKVEDFFVAQSGNYSTFSFPDPISGTDVLNCRIGSPELHIDYVGTDAASATLWVIETNG